VTNRLSKRVVNFVFIGKELSVYVSQDRKKLRILPTVFAQRPVVVTQGQPLDVEAIIAAFDQLVDGFTCRGSGFVLDLIKKLTAVFVP